jgi:AcrR family transcriptional regulator
MAQTNGTVKKKRSYDSSRRRESARLSRARVLDAAERRFLRNGYGPTTIAAIAADADVSADTIYKSFKSKAGLIRAIRARALQGEGAVPAEQRSDALHQQHETDPRQIIQAWGAFVAEIMPRAAPILLLIRAAAATDPEALALLNEMDADRHNRMTRNARRLHNAGHLRAGITVARAADVLWTYSAPELYELLVVRRRWSPQRYGRFAADAMITALL